ncbi:MAG: hypothetical protein ACYTHK_07505 [Planctomycetota bacterium]
MQKTLIALFLFLPPALAQDSKEPERALETKETRVEPTPHELLASALLDIGRAGDRVIEAEIKHKQPEREVQVQGGGNQAIRVVQHVSINGAGEPYEGKVEAWRDADGATVIVSRRELPGFGLYLTEDRAIRRMTTEDKVPDLTQLQTELMSFLDGKRFSKHALAAELKHELDEASGDHVFNGAVDKHIVRPVRTAAGDPRFGRAFRGMQPKVLRAKIELRVTPKGRLKSAKVTIVRNDPAREMMRGGAFGGRIVIQGGQGGFKVVPDNKDDEAEEKHDIEGLSTIYRLNFSQKDPSERAKAFKREIIRALTE